jgi:hypothetical protein
VNLLACEGERESGGVRGEFAAGLFGGCGDFLFSGAYGFINVVFGGVLDAVFLGDGFFFRCGLHLSDFNIQLAQASLDVREAAASVLTGGTRFLQGLLDGGGAAAENSGQKFSAGPRNDDDDDQKI